MGQVKKDLRPDAAHSPPVTHHCHNISLLLINYYVSHTMYCVQNICMHNQFKFGIDFNNIDVL